MTTNTASQISQSSYGQDSHLAATEAWKEQGTTAFSWRRLVKWFGVLSTALIGAAAFAPSVFGIPTDLQPWVFLASIFWFFAFCAGMFDL
jgi:hypothetical protein